MTTAPMTWESAVLWLRAQPGQLDLVRNAYYDDPLTDAAIRFEKSAEWAAVVKFLPPRPGTALEVGAGRGIVSFALARRGWDVHAVEPDPSAIVGAGAIETLARECAGRLQVSRDHGEKLPFPAASFDLVFCRQVLHHARDLGQVCREMGRVLKAGGTFVATREHVLSKHEDLQKFLESHPLHMLYRGENAYLLREYREAICAAGIRIRHTLNPLASDINLFPQTHRDARERVARQLRVPQWLVPSLAVRLAGNFLSTPGRLYSFIGTKAA